MRHTPSITMIYFKAWWALVGKGRVLLLIILQTKQERGVPRRTFLFLNKLVLNKWNKTIWCRIILFLLED